MTAPDTKHATRRELWLLLDEGSNRALVRDSGEKWPDDVGGEPSSKFIHVRECLPGEVTITREELRVALLLSFAESTHKYQENIEAALFGPLSPEGQQVGE